MDMVAAASSWTLFYIYRKLVVEPVKMGMTYPVRFDGYFFFSLLTIVCFWLVLHWVSGAYKNVYRKSRLREFGQTLLWTFIGTIIMFFVLILDDIVVSYKTYYGSFFTLFGLNFFLTYFLRLILTSRTIRRIHRREIGFPTILVGSNEKALETFSDLEEARKSAGNLFKGFVSVDNNIAFLAEREMKHLGSYHQLPEIIAENAIEEVIIAIESAEHSRLETILNLLEDTDVIIKIIPDTYDLVSGRVRTQSIFGTPLIEIKHDLMPNWEFTLKRSFDILVSVLAIILLSPLLIFTAIMVKLSSKGPVFYAQIRIGLHRKPFYIVKFRSMYTDAEREGPQLSSKEDPRITPWGKVMRKYRLDELPQFWNVLLGDMSIVGPRPERPHFIKQIEAISPHYRHLHKVRPGITSWGMVKYGYAESVEQMIQRMKYDIIYIENMSFIIDMKILIYTILIVLQGRGK
jgi:exopolysaccharide biosynthesis polyprenyl glycosylphosphotransferase